MRFLPRRHKVNEKKRNELFLNKEDVLAFVSKHSKKKLLDLKSQIAQRMNSMYDVLLQLPIFQGVSRNKISELIEKMKFHFLKYPDGEKIVSIGEECNHLKFLISGEIRSELVTQNEKMRITETIQAPNVIAPEHLFGRDTYFPANLYAVGTVGVMQIEKASVVQMLQEEQMRIAGFAYYLLDYQGFYDDFFKKRLRSLSIFAGMIFLRKVNFFGAEHRLLEITKKYDLAICCSQKENVAKFILCNLDKYSKKELQIIRYRLEHASISVLYERPNVCLLYKICCYKTSWWRLIF